MATALPRTPPATVETDFDTLIGRAREVAALLGIPLWLLSQVLVPLVSREVAPTDWWLDTLHTNRLTVTGDADALDAFAKKALEGRSQWLPDEEIRAFCAGERLPDWLLQAVLEWRPLKFWAFGNPHKLPLEGTAERADVCGTQFEPWFGFSRGRDEEWLLDELVGILDLDWADSKRMPEFREQFLMILALKRLLYRVRRGANSLTYRFETGCGQTERGVPRGAVALMAAQHPELTYTLKWARIDEPRRAGEERFTAGSHSHAEADIYDFLDETGNWIEDRA